jgi:Tfp pilus assembly protein PilO
MNKVITVALAPLLLGGASYALVWRPHANDIADANARRDTARAQLVALQAKKQPTTKTPTDAKQTATALAAAQAAVPAKMDLGAFLGAMNETASAAAVSIVTNTPGQPTPYAGPNGSPAGSATTATTKGTSSAVGAGGATGLTTISFSQTVQGERSRLIDYTTKLEKLPRLVVIDSMSLTSEVAGSSSMQLQLHIFATGS